MDNKEAVRDIIRSANKNKDLLPNEPRKAYAVGIAHSLYVGGVFNASDFNEMVDIIKNVDCDKIDVL